MTTIYYNDYNDCNDYNDFSDYNDYNDYSDYDDYNNYNDYRDSDLNLDLDWEWISDLVTQLTITDKSQKLNHEIEEFWFTIR